MEMLAEVRLHCISKYLIKSDTSIDSIEGP